MRKIIFIVLFTLSTGFVMGQDQMQIETSSADVLSLKSTGSDATVMNFLNSKAVLTGGSNKRAYISTNGNFLNIGLSNNNMGGRIEFFGKSDRRMTMTADGLFGIGDIIPTQQLDVDGQVKIRSLPAGAASDQFLTADANGNIRKVTGSSTQGSAGGDLTGSFPNPTVDGIHGRKVVNGALLDGNILRYSGQQDQWYYDDYPSSPFISSGSSIINVPSSYNVGIGTSFPQAKLDIRSNSTTSAPNINVVEKELDFARIRMSNTSYSSRPWMIEARSNATDAGGLFKISYTNAAGDIIDPIKVYGDNQVAMARVSPPNSIATLHVGSTNGANVTIGSSEYWEDGGAFAMETNASLYPSVDNQRDLGKSLFRWNDVYAGNGVVTTSDRRDKTNIQPLDYGLSEIMQLNPVSFTWKDKPEQGIKLGLIAQDLQEVVGEVVKTYDHYENEQTGKSERVELERLGVYYSDLIPVLIKAIQDQQKKIESLERKVEALTPPVWANK